MEDPVKIYKDVLKIAGESKANESDGMQVDWWDSLSQDERSNWMNSFSMTPTDGSIYMDNYDEMDSSNQYYVKSLFRFVKDNTNNDLLGRNHNILDESKAVEYTDEEQKILDHTMEAARMEGFAMDPNAFTTPHTWVQGSAGADDIYCKICGVSKSFENHPTEDEMDVLDPYRSYRKSPDKPQKTWDYRETKESLAKYEQDRLENLYEDFNDDDKDAVEDLENQGYDRYEAISKIATDMSYESKASENDQVELKKLLDATLEKIKFTTDYGERQSLQALYYATKEMLDGYESKATEEETELFDDKRGDIDDWGEIEDISQEPEDI